MLLRDHSRPAPSKTESSVQQTVYLEGASIPIGAANIISVVAQPTIFVSCPFTALPITFLLFEMSIIYCTQRRRQKTINHRSPKKRANGIDPHEVCERSNRTAKPATNCGHYPNRIDPTRGLIILLARLSARGHKGFFSLCHYFAIMKPVAENESRHLGQNEMSGLKGKSGPAGNMNAFKHGLAAIQKRREEGVPTEHGETVRQQILDGLMIGLNDLQYEFETKIEVQCSPFSIC